MEKSDPFVLQRLLDEISNRVAGAIDIWTLASLGQIPNPHAFLRKNADILNSFVLVFRTIALRDMKDKRPDNLLQLLDQMTTGCQGLADLLIKLERFHDLREEEINSACDLLAHSYRQIQVAIRHLAQLLKVSPDTEKTIQRDQYHQGILRSLFGHFVQEKEKGTAAAKEIHR